MGGIITFYFAGLDGRVFDAETEVFFSFREQWMTKNEILRLRENEIIICCIGNDKRRKEIEEMGKK